MALILLLKSKDSIYGKEKEGEIEGIWQALITII